MQVFLKNKRNFWIVPRSYNLEHDLFSKYLIILVFIIEAMQRTGKIKSINGLKSFQTLFLNNFR